jgi:Cys-tRNA(Pro) deacylase
MADIMGKEKQPVTQAIRILRSHKVAFKGHPYAYEPGGGTRQFASLFGVDEHEVIKTLIMEDENKKPFIVLMHGDQEVSTKALARELGVKSVLPCDPKVADRHSGYQVGGTSPFGTRRVMPIYCEKSIVELPRIYINGGKRGYIISMATADMVAILAPVMVEASQAP